jgi:hypothetical protein
VRNRKSLISLISPIRGSVRTGRHFGEKFPQKKSGFDIFGLGKIPSLLRKRARVPVQETFTEGSGTTDLPKLRATGKGHPKE